MRWRRYVKILGIDTSTNFLALALNDDKKLFEYRLEAGRRISLLLTQTIQRTLDALKWEAGDIDYFACGIGPGSFTGVRMGLATIKGLAWSLHKPVIGISTLDIIARGTGFREGVIFSAIDAKRGLIYCSAYKIKNGTQKRIMPYMLLTEDEFLRKVGPNSMISGDAIALYGESISRQIRGVGILDKDYWYPRPGNIIEIALERIKQAKYGNAFGILPIYLYPKECQIRKTQKKQSKG